MEDQNRAGCSQILFHVFRLHFAVDAFRLLSQV